MDETTIDFQPEGRRLGSGDPVGLAAFDQYRSLLFSVAYRMLGSVADAEDMVQETFIRWQHAAGEDFRSPRAFLVTVITRLCINHLQSARVRREGYVGQWLPEPLVTDQGGDPFGLVRVDESLSMAFLILLEQLTPVERAVFLLREVFEYEYSEISGVLGQTESNCRQIFRRAPQHAAAMRPRFRTSPEKRNDLLEKFLRATGSGDMEALLALLTDDVGLHADGGGKAVAVPNVIYGAAKVARAIVKGRAKFGRAETAYRVASVNGVPGAVTYSKGKVFSVLTLASLEGQIRAIYLVTNPDKLAHIPELPRDDRSEQQEGVPKSFS